MCKLNTKISSRPQKQSIIHNKFQRAVNQTGGGTQPRQEDFIYKLESEVVDIYARTLSFEGLRRFDTEPTQDMHFFLLFVF